MDKNTLKSMIAKQAASLAHDEITTREEFVKEYAEQLETGEYNTYLRSWIGWKIESGCKDAIEVMKNIIRLNLSDSSQRV